MLKNIIAGKFGIIILIAVGLIIWNQMKKVEAKKQ